MMMDIDESLSLLSLIVVSNNPWLRCARGEVNSQYRRAVSGLFFSCFHAFTKKDLSCLRGKSATLPVSLCVKITMIL